MYILLFLCLIISALRIYDNSIKAGMDWKKTELG